MPAVQRTLMHGSVLQTPVQFGTIPMGTVRLLSIGGSPPRARPSLARRRARTRPENDGCVAPGASCGAGGRSRYSITRSLAPTLSCARHRVGSRAAVREGRRGAAQALRARPRAVLALYYVTLPHASLKLCSCVHTLFKSRLWPKCVLVACVLHAHARQLWA